MSSSPLFFQATELPLRRPDTYIARQAKTAASRKTISFTFRDFASESMAVLVNLSFMTRMAMIVRTMVATVIMIVNSGIPPVAVLVLMRVSVLV